MTTYTIYAAAGDGHIFKNKTPYETFDEGTSDGTAYTAFASLYVGQWPTYQGNQSFLEFDCSGIDSAETVTSAVLSLYVDNNYMSSPQGFTINLLDYDWGTLTVASWRGSSTFGSYTLLGSKAVDYNTATGSRIEFSDLAMSAKVDAKSAATKFVMVHGGQGTAPASGTYERMRFKAGDDTTGSDRTYLTVTAEVVSGGTIEEGAGSASGAATVSGAALAAGTQEGAGAGSGVAVVTGAAQSTWASAGASTGAATATGDASSLAVVSGAGAASGAAAVDGQAATFTVSAAAGLATGAADAGATASALASASGGSTGITIVIGGAEAAFVSAGVGAVACYAQATAFGQIDLAPKYNKAGAPKVIATRQRRQGVIAKAYIRRISR